MLNNFSKFPTVIIAAGKGQRAKSITKDLPKYLYPLNFEPNGSLFLLLRSIDIFNPRKVVVVGGDRYELLHDFLIKKGDLFKKIYVVDAKPNCEKGPLYSMLASKKYVDSSEGFWLFPADTVFIRPIFEHLAKIRLDTKYCAVFYTNLLNIPKFEVRHLVLTTQEERNYLKGIDKRSSTTKNSVSDSNPLNLMIPIVFLTHHFLQYAFKSQNLGFQTVSEVIMQYIKDNGKFEAHYLPLQNNKTDPFLDLDDVNAFNLLKKRDFVESFRNKQID